MRRGGFTLVEVLVSLAIFALAAVALAGAYTNVLLARQAMRQLDVADDALARSRSALLETAGLEDAKAGDDIDLPDGRKATWSCDIEPTNVSDLFSVTLTVETSAAAGGKPEAARAQTFYLLRPSWSVSGDRTKLTDAARERLRRLRPYAGTSLIDQQGSAGGGTSGGGRDGQGGGGRGRGEGGGRGRGDNPGADGGRGDGPGGGRGGNADGGRGPAGGPGGGTGGAQPPPRGGNNNGGGPAPRAR